MQCNVRHQIIRHVASFNTSVLCVFGTRQGFPVYHTLYALPCRYAHSPTLAGRDPKSVLLPSAEPLRSMVLAAAERLGLDGCLGKLAPPEEVNSHLTDMYTRCSVGLVHTPSALLWVIPDTACITWLILSCTLFHMGLCECKFT